ncbi:MAG TPA: polymer-forming cytoskeletal protein [Alphaproteobacteria bacterium]|nr:polymer-forming cytoskeletal protein [Alphaproteobacteria bacterium]
MWKSRPEEKPAQGSLQSNTPATSLTSNPSASKDMNKPGEPFRTEVGHIGKSVMVKGELSGSEDLYLDGQVEGNIDLRDHALTIGPNGRIHANIQAREVLVFGKVDGNIHATEKAELKKTCVLTGDVSTKRIVIEDGAFFKGAIDIQKEGKNEPRKASGASSNSGAANLQGALLESK